MPSLCPRGLRLVGIGLTGLLWCAPAFALSIDEAVALALEKNPEIHAERQRLAEAEAELLGVRNPFNPVAEAELGLRKGPDETSADVVLGITQEFELGGQHRQRKALADSKIALAKAEILEREQVLAAEVRRAFAAAVVARAQLEQSQQLSALAQTLLDSAQLRFDEGASSKLELNLARSELAKARRDRLLAEQGMSTALTEFRRLLGLKRDEELAVPREPELPERLMPTAEAVETAAGNRAELEALRLEGRLALAERDLARALARPNLEAGVQAGKEGEETLAGVTVGLPIPLFQRQKAAERAAEARERRAGLQAVALQVRIETELEAAAQRYQAAREAVELYRTEILPLFEENLELLNESFKTGKVNFLQVLTVQKEFVEQRQAYLESLLLAQDALVDWQVAAGLVIPLPGVEKGNP